MLNHRSVTHSTVAAIYDRYQYDKEKRAALDKWADNLAVSVRPQAGPAREPPRRLLPSNVLELRPARLA